MTLWSGLKFSGARDSTGKNHSRPIFRTFIGHLGILSSKIFLFCALPLFEGGGTIFSSTADGN